MIISSRTPEGDRNRCPLCAHEIVIEPSAFFGDAPCPHCGHLLWFVKLGAETRVFARSETPTIHERVVQIIAEQMGVSADRVTGETHFINDLGADSLDTVELAMELEEEFEMENDENADEFDIP